MRLLLIATFVGFGEKHLKYFQVGGAENSILALIEELSKKINDFYLLTSTASDPIDIPNVIHLRLLSWRKAVVAGQFVGYKDKTIKKVVNSIKPDIIDSQEKYSAGLIAPHHLQIPIIQTLRDYWFACPQNTLLDSKNKDQCSGSSIKKCTKCYLYLRIKPKSKINRIFFKLRAPILATTFKYAHPRIRLYLKQSKRLLSTSYTLKEFFLQQYPQQEFTSEIQVVGNPLIWEFNQDQTFNRKPFFVWAGRLSYEKGIRLALNAFYHYKKRGGQSNLIIAGDGPLKSIVVNAANKNKGVHYLGWISQSKLNKLILKSKAYISLHLWNEPFGRIVASSVGAGTPVITSQYGEPRKMVEKSHCGYVVNPHDYEDISRLLLDIDHLTRDDYECFYFNGQNFVKNNFSPARIAQNYLKTYQDVMT